jgi:hypothetical protein
VDDQPKARWNSLCHEERQFSCDNRGKMAAIKQRPSESLRLCSEALASVTQFVQRDEVNVQLCALAWVYF